jgi:hypothetical protein
MTIREIRRRPTIEQLRDRAEEGGYGGGRGKMDTKEWYQLCYFEPLEDFLFQSLRTKYPDMALHDVSVCVSAWIYIHSVDPSPNYGEISDRILWLSAGGRFSEEGGIKPEIMMEQAFERGYISYNTVNKITLRQDIEDFTSQLVDKECEECDAELIAKYGRQALDEINEIHRKKQSEFADCRRNHK